jgi:hypothetical protein
MQNPGSGVEHIEETCLLSTACCSDTLHILATNLRHILGNTRDV